MVCEITLVCVYVGTVILIKELNQGTNRGIKSMLGPLQARYLLLPQHCAHPHDDVITQFYPNPNPNQQKGRIFAALVLGLGIIDMALYVNEPVKQRAWSIPKTEVLPNLNEIRALSIAALDWIRSSSLSIRIDLSTYRHVKMSPYLSYIPNQIGGSAAQICSQDSISLLFQTKWRSAAQICS